MEEILVPFFVCVVLPVTIVWLVMATRRNETNRKTEVMLKAIESGVDIDPDFFKSDKKSKTIKQNLLERLTGACVTSLLGIAFLIVGILTGNTTAWSFGGLKPLPLAGAVLLAIGIALFIVYSVGKKMLAKEIEAEEKAIEDPRQ